MRASFDKVHTAVRGAEFFAPICCSFGRHPLAVTVYHGRENRYRLLLPSHLANPISGANVYVFNPGMPQSLIQATVDSIAAQQVVPIIWNAALCVAVLSRARMDPAPIQLNFQVGYYTAVAGLGLFALATWSINGVGLRT